MEIEDIQKFCKSFPGIREDIKWGDNLCLMAGEKIFCMISLDAVPVTIGFKTDPVEFDELIHQDGFVPAPYLAKSHWVLHKNMKGLPATQLKNHLAKSYGLVVSKMTAKAKTEAGIAVGHQQRGNSKNPGGNREQPNKMGNQKSVGKSQKSKATSRKPEVKSSKLKVESIKAKPGKTKVKAIDKSTLKAIQKKKGRSGK
ncbi:MmcQ/YjbR family DNA-binding protein [Pollutibacter soli]|uniref:MmcQ/YjbR family DNA-binding protein n=1 Tax=Pollutibacter soli TaxID=3034157 RepID=UPI0030139523